MICTPTGKDAALLTRCLEREGVSSTCFHETESLAQALDADAEAVIIAEEGLRPDGVERLFEYLKLQEAWSDIAVILLTYSGQETSQVGAGLVQLFGQHGNVTMLERPLRVPTLLSAVRSARRARRRQYQVRDLLKQRDDSARVLREAHDELERRVLQRTMEITKANFDLRREVSERLNAENALRQLSQNIVRLQDEERRRIARELHDSAGQYLSAVTLTLEQLARRYSGEDEKNKQLIQEALGLVGDCIKEVRTMSYLLHPPVLDDFGLASALRWYVEGFSQRSGIHVRLDLAEVFPRLNRELETALFRIVQEGLTNIHRHSGGHSATVELTIFNKKVNAIISDDGHGMPANMLEKIGRGHGGVGLMGMYERVKQLGGSIHIDSGGAGTKITTELPISVAAV